MGGNGITGDVGHLANLNLHGTNCLHLTSEEVTTWPLHTATNYTCTFIDENDHNC